MRLSHVERISLNDFSAFGLAEPLARAVRDAGYSVPTPIQARSIPDLLQGHDLLGIAQTGTGKTAAFALPILHRLLNEQAPARGGQVRALILAPTRELAGQIAESFRVYARHTSMKIGCIFGGVSAGPQIAMLARGLDVLVATPGRLLDHMGAGKASLAATRIVVLDEADHMLDLGFVVPIRRIIAKLPRERQNLFFSATMPQDIAKLAHEFLRDPVKVSVTPAATTVERINQRAILIEAGAKSDLLVELLNGDEFRRAIVFTRTKRGADKVSRRLEAANISALAIHGNKSQNQRQRALDSFKSGEVRVLVATDIAARGIDIDAVTHVINYELPEVPEAYVHRIGRTARAGADGAAVALVDGSEQHLLRAIEKATRQSIPLTDRRGTVTVTKMPDRPATPRPAPRGKARNHAGQARPPVSANAGQTPQGAKPRGKNRGGQEQRGNNAPREIWSNRPGGDRPWRSRRDGARAPA